MWCQICYTSSQESDVSQLPCRCVSCSDCLTSWIVTQAMELHYQTHENIPCLNASCKKPFKVQDIASQLTQQQQDVVNSILFDVYLKKTQDIRRCPNNRCSYAGVISTVGTCADKLECPNCGTRWREKVHYTAGEKIKDFMANRDIRTNEVMSDIWQEAFTRKCPKCLVNIQKNGGCNHMTCKRCQHEFCWLCNQNHHGHKRRVCRMTCLAKFMVLALPVLNVMWLTGILQLVSDVVTWTINLMVGGLLLNTLIFILFSLYNTYRSSRRYVYLKRKKREGELTCFGIGGLALLILGTIKYLGLFASVGQVACFEALAGIIFREHTKRVKYVMLYAGDICRYLVRNRRILYVYARSYFIR